MTDKQAAYKVGVLAALQEHGLVKVAGSDTAWAPALASYLPFGGVAGPAAGAITAPEGKGWAGAGGTFLGQLLGTTGGAVAGAAGGAGIGALIGLIAKNPAVGAGLGAAVGTGLGALLGLGVGAGKGYRMAVGEPEEQIA